MTTTEHLQLIKAKCDNMLGLAEIEPQSFMETAVAGWRATKLYIDHLFDLIAVREEPYLGAAIYDAKRLLAAWPIELLTNKPQ